MDTVKMGLQTRFYDRITFISNIYVPSGGLVVSSNPLVSIIPKIVDGEGEESFVFVRNVNYNCIVNYNEVIAKIIPLAALTPAVTEGVTTNV